MKLWKTIDIADKERALLYRRGRLKSVLMPGRHRLWNLGQSIRLETYDVTSLWFEHPQAKWLLTQYSHLLSDVLERVEAGDTQLGLVYVGGILVDLLPPGRSVTNWKGIDDVRIELVDIEQSLKVDTSLLRLLLRNSKPDLRAAAVKAIAAVEISDEHVGLLIVDGELVELLSPGSYGYWRFGRDVKVQLMDLRLQSMDVNGQEILTKDRVSLRINLSASYRVENPRTAALQLNDYAGFIYRELQLRLREAVGTQLLDELLADKDALNGELAKATRNKLSEYGIALLDVGVKDIILPGEMKTLLNRVVEAQKEAEANLIRRREETQAMRSLHNTAKVMENNPTLLRLKELEALERVSENIDRISVYGGLEGVMNDLVKLSGMGQ